MSRTKYIKATKMELKPCPFCKSEAKFEPNGSDTFGIFCQNIKCRARVIQGITFKYYPKNIWVKGNFDETEMNTRIWAYNKLVPKWNKRKT